MPKFKYLLLILLMTANAFANWTPPTRIHIGGGYYPTILVNGDTIHAAYSKQISRTQIIYVRSTDRGATWSRGVKLNDTLSFSSGSYPRILSGPSSLIILWREVERVGSQANIACCISSDGGENWGEPRHVLNPGFLDVGVFSAANNDSLLNVIYERLIWPNIVLFNTRSTNFGMNWSYPRQLVSAYDVSLMDMEAYGDTFHMVWSGNFDQSANWEVYYIRSLNEGLSWSQVETLTTPGDRGARSPALSINEAGNLAMTFMDFRYSPPGFVADLFLSKSTNQGASWFGETQITSIHQDIDPDEAYHGDTIDVAFQRQDIPRGTICHIRSTDEGASWGDVTELDLDPSDSHEPKIGTSSGRTYVIWIDDRPNPDTSTYGGLYFARYDPEPDAIVENEEIKPGALSISAYPNPFNSATTISLSKSADCEIVIYDIQGKKITTLQAKDGWAIWNAAGYSSGVYFARVAGNCKAAIIRMVLLK